MDTLSRNIQRCDGLFGGVAGMGGNTRQAVLRQHHIAGPMRNGSRWRACHCVARKGRALDAARLATIDRSRVESPPPGPA
ncbi:MAG: hypothetical protein ACREO3_08870, partial [Arenimonas sp.]